MAMSNYNIDLNLDEALLHVCHCFHFARPQFVFTKIRRSLIVDITKSFKYVLRKSLQSVDSNHRDTVDSEEVAQNATPMIDP